MNFESKDFFIIMIFILFCKYLISLCIKKSVYEYRMQVSSVEKSYHFFKQLLSKNCYFNTILQVNGFFYFDKKKKKTFGT